ncbi:MAG: HlyD family secretion protein, partial [Clostridiales bacterium]|nr:HlyD family secretion protein [Clostridiales bacterium]
MSKIYTFNELKESALIYDRKPPAFGGIITFLTLVFMIAIMFLAAFSVKTSIVNATGIAVSGDKTNIMNRVSGAIERIYVWEGQRVSTGDVLIEIDGYQAELQITQLEANADFYRGKLELMERLIIFINGFTLSIPETRTNPFDENDIDE